MAQKKDYRKLKKKIFFLKICKWVKKIIMKKSKV